MAAPQFSDLATLTTNTAFQARINIAIATYAAFILDTEAPTIQFHNNRFSWAKSAIFNPNGVMNQIIWKIVLDPAIAALSAPIDQTLLTDAQINTITQTAINNTFLAFY